jgi:hypothetical protein
VQFIDHDMFFTSLRLDARKKKKITFLFGSAISFPHNGRPGVPSAGDIVNTIKEYFTENGIDGEYDKYITNNKDKSPYQASFEYLLGVSDTDEVENIMNRVMSNVRNGEKWIIPTVISDIAYLISKNFFNIDHILTTNFDPLIEEALKENGVETLRLVMTEDGDLDQGSIISDGNSIKVVHLHGFWNGDTLHTPVQLTTERNRLKASLIKILSESKLYVIGYGGWDDIINKAIADVVHTNSNYNIKWGFYDDRDDSIKKEHEHNFKKFASASLRGRISCYKGVDCNNLFDSLKEHQIKNESNEKTEIIALEDVYNPSQKKHTENILNSFSIPNSASHKNIRIKEQDMARRELNENGCFTLLCDWGSGKYNFISSVVANFDVTTYRVDMSSVNCRSQALDKFKTDIGVEHQLFFLSQDKKQYRVKNNYNIIIFDNIINTNPDVVDYINDMIGIFKDLSYTKGIFILPQQCELNNTIIELLPLNTNDIITYFEDTSNRFNISGFDYDRISQKTAGLPAKIDIIKKHLKIAELDYILSDSSGELEEQKYETMDAIPLFILEAINHLSSSQAEDHTRHFSLLKVLSMYPYGEQVSKISRFYSEKNFKLSDFHYLASQGMIQSINIEPMKICRVSPLIRDYIISQMSPDECILQRRQAASLILGDQWRNGKVSISKANRETLNNHSLSPGNAHVFLIDLLKDAIAEDKDINVLISASISYCMFLKNQCRYKELAVFSNEAHKLSSELISIDLYCLAYYQAEGLRMTNQEQTAINLLNSIIFDISPDGEFYNKNLYKNALSTLILCYSILGEPDAYALAKKLISIVPSNSGDNFLCKSILAEMQQKQEKIKTLKKIEKAARRKDHVVVANNICLDLARLEPHEREKLADKVIASNESPYTTMRAFLIKCNCRLNTGEPIYIGSDNFNQLLGYYQYLSIQGMTSLFNKCHDLLWRICVVGNEIEYLSSLYYTSSLIWRTIGDKEKRLKCEESLIRFLEEKNHPGFLINFSNRE